MEQLWGDVRLAVRALVRQPGSSLLIILTLAVGISVNTIVFSLINGLLFKPAPFANRDRMAGIKGTGGPAREYGAVSLDELRALARELRAADAVTAEARLGLGMQTPAGTDQVWALIVSDNYFPVIGAEPLRGRTFDERDRGKPVVVVSDAFARRQFGGDNSPAGRTLTLNNQIFAVAGVLPDSLHGFSGLYRPDVWMPLSALDLLGLRDLSSPDRRWLHAAAHLAPGRQDAQLQAELASLSPRIAEEAAAPADGRVDDAADRGAAPYANAGRAGAPRGGDGGARRRVFTATPMRDGPAELRMLRPVGLIALAVVGLVLALACFNVTGLLLARAAERRREMGVRAALGASHARLTRQLLTESLLLAIVASAAALIVAIWSHDLVSAFRLPSPIPQDIDMRPDWRLVLFAAALAAAAGVLPALAPAWHVRRLDLVRVLKNEDRGASGAQPGSRRALLLMEIAGSTFLLAISMLCLQSFRQMSTLDFGFEPSRGLVLAIDPTTHGHRPGAAAARYAEQVVQRIRAIPGVHEAAATIRPPAGVGFLVTSTAATDASDCQGDGCPPVTVVRAGPGYFQALRIPLIAGAGFEPHAAPRRDAVVIEERLAGQLWPGRSPIGEWIRLGRDRERFQVIGVAANVNHVPSSGEDRYTEVYRLLPEEEHGGDLAIVVGTHGDPAPLAASVRAAVHAVDRDVPIARMQTMTGHLELARWPSRTLAAFSLACAAVALLLATVGLFGVTHRNVAQRLRELGVRSALGAHPRQLLSLVLRDGVRLTAPGVLIGIGAAAIASFPIRSLLVQVSPLDPTVYAAVALLQAIVTLAACAMPALRAARVDPISVLRTD